VTEAPPPSFLITAAAVETSGEADTDERLLPPVAPPSP
jgi:hypothetical protein